MSNNEYISSSQWQKVVRACIDDLGVFGRLCFPHLFKLPPAKIHATFIEMGMDFTLEHGIIEVYRESAKTTYFAEILPLWHTYCEPFKRENFYPSTFEEMQSFLDAQSKVFVVIQSKSARHAQDRISSISLPLGASDVLKDEEQMGMINFQIHFGVPDIISSRIEHLKTDRGTYLSLGGKMQAHGLNIGGTRPTLFIIDDPETEENTKTEYATKGTFDALYNGVINGKAHGARGYTLFTPIRSHSFGRRLKALVDVGMPNWKYIHSPLIKDINTPNERSTWEERFPLVKVKKELHSHERAGTSYQWWQKYQCVLLVTQSQLFRPQDIQLYDGSYFRENEKWYLRLTHRGAYAREDGSIDTNSPYALEEPEIIPVELYTGLDPSHGTGHNNATKITRAFDGRNSYTHTLYSRNDVDIYGQCLWIIEGNEKEFMQDLEENGTTDRELIEGYNTLHETAIIVEGNFFEKAMERPLRDILNESNTYLPIVVDNPRISKDEKYVVSLVPIFRRKRIFFKKSHLFAISTFTNFSTLEKDQADDEIDALYLSFHRNYAPLHTKNDLQIKEQDSTPISHAQFRRDAESWKISSPKTKIGYEQYE